MSTSFQWSIRTCKSYLIHIVSLSIAASAQLRTISARVCALALKTLARVSMHVVICSGRFAAAYAKPFMEVKKKNQWSYYYHHDHCRRTKCTINKYNKYKIVQLQNNKAVKATFLFILYDSDLPLQIWDPVAKLVNVAIESFVFFQKIYATFSGVNFCVPRRITTSALSVPRWLFYHVISGKCGWRVVMRPDGVH